MARPQRAADEICPERIDAHRLEPRGWRRFGDGHAFAEHAGGVEQDLRRPEARIDRGRELLDCRYVRNVAGERLATHRTCERGEAIGAPANEGDAVAFGRECTR